MESQRFDHLARAIARRLPRRGLLAALGTGGLATLPGRKSARAQANSTIGPTPADTESRVVSILCRPCQCNDAGEDCECCLNGVTGGGIVRTAASDATLVLFATAVGDAADRQATGFVRWIDPGIEGGITLESVGPIAYEWEGLETATAREIRGTMSVNRAGEEPFVLRLTAGETAADSDTAWLEVGDLAALQGDLDAFAYAAQGPLVGGDIQLLDEVTPVG